MALSLRQIKSRIRSIESTKKLTRAMEMISISKLRRAEHALVSSREYHARLKSLLMDVLAQGQLKHPFLKPPVDKSKVALCAIASDTGFCSSYNHLLFYVADNFLRAYDPAKVSVVAVGKKSFSYFKNKGYALPHALVGLHGKFSDEASAGLLKSLVDLYASGEASEVYVAYMQVTSLTRYKPVVEKVLDIERETRPERKFIFEPGFAGVLEKLIPEFLASKMRVVLLNAFTAEHRARSIAMGEATQNASELLEDLILTRNKLRQANITREIIEVVTSAEALKG